MWHRSAQKLFSLWHERINLSSGINMFVWGNMVFTVYLCMEYPDGEFWTNTYINSFLPLLHIDSISSKPSSSYFSPLGLTWLYRATRSSLVYSIWSPKTFSIDIRYLQIVCWRTLIQFCKHVDLMTWNYGFIYNIILMQLGNRQKAFSYLLKNTLVF